MNIKPILMNSEMVRAILEDRKMVTRRAAFPNKDLREFQRKEYPHGWWFRGRAYRTWDDAMREPQGVMSHCKYSVGDILYVRETWAAWSRTEGIMPEIHYKADGEALPGVKWRPSIHMPREAARIFLRVTDVIVERLQKITELDILEKEGLTVDFPQPKPSYMSLAYTETRLKPAVRKAFADLWDCTIKPADRTLYGWDANPWVWVIAFERCEPPEEWAK